MKPSVILDAGHGGKDSGAVGPGGLQEKAVALSVVMLLGALLIEAGVDVHYTRKSDVFIELAERARLGNEKGVDLFVSVHCNSADNPAGGFEVYTTPGKTKSDDAATECFKTFGDEFPSARRRMDSSDGDPDKEANFAVLRLSHGAALLQGLLDELGYQPDPEKRGGLQDLSSARRLGLIWQMQLDMAHGHARWQSGMKQDVLDAFPAQELVRDHERMERRDWPQIWKDHNGVFYGEPGPDYPGAPGRMIALKTDPIWTEISRFGVPWPPFDWGSGMGLRNVRRREAEKLGLLDPEDAMIPQDKPFTQGVRASTKGLPVASLERIRSEFGDYIKFDPDEIVWNYTPKSDEHPRTEIRETLRARARSGFERGEAALGRLRRNDNGAEAFYGSPQADEIRRLYLAQAAAVSVGRKALFHDTFNEGEGRALERAIREGFPGVMAEWRDGHLIAWRPGLLNESADELHALSDGESPRNGMLLGYGRESMALPGEDHALVLIQNAAGETVTGFHAPRGTADVFAQARLRDLADATGEAFTYVIVPRKGGAQ